MITTNDIKSMMAAINAGADDTAWLALADALEEAGRDEEAALIRDDAKTVTIEEDKVVECVLRNYVYHEEGGHQEGFTAYDMDDAIEWAEKYCRRGDWGGPGTVRVWVEEVDEDGNEIDRRHFVVEVE